MAEEKVEQENLSEEEIENQNEEAVAEENATEAEAEEINEWEVKYKEMNDKFLRLYSEFENFRKRTAKEKLELMQTANKSLMKDILPIVDDFERAADANKENEDATSLKEGFELIQNKLFKTLENKGLKPMDAKGNVFDVDVHEALTNIPAPSEDLKGKVVDVVEKGYYLNDTVLRYAKVVVGQ